MLCPRALGRGQGLFAATHCFNYYISRRVSIATNFTTKRWKVKKLVERLVPTPTLELHMQGF